MTTPPTRHCFAALLAVLLSAGTQAAPAHFTSYNDFYRSLGDPLFEGKGTALDKPCTDAPRACLWTTSMTQALRRYEATDWIVPGTLQMNPADGAPDIAFDGQTLMVGARRWPLRSAVALAPPDWPSRTPIDPENLANVTAWQQGTSVCLDMHYVSSGKGGRYTLVMLLHGEHLYTLPPLFGSCVAIQKAAGDGFSYPSTTYLGPGMETNPSGLQVDYLLSDGTTRVARYLLRFPDQSDPFTFEASRVR
ncbi:hypothetical protein [Stenotrophomonas sp.]|jgi:hypothetical protein|uniref:hypothetical protein n=1 Tax=unclassified Stenotrophomonas TaxID=196198 RepID=UPI0028A68DD8|nr:hypothetical protein [Stenotrophomonas sp.]